MRRNLLYKQPKTLTLLNGSLTKALVPQVNICAKAHYSDAKAGYSRVKASIYAVFH